MSELISGKEALIALADGGDVQASVNGFDWKDAVEFGLVYFLNGDAHFRIKPRTIAINGIDVPAPFEPNKDDDCRVYVIDTRNICGWDWQHSSHFKSGHIVWRTEEEIKQVVAALRSVFGKK